MEGIKIGIGNKPENLNLIDFVLGEFLEDEINILSQFFLSIAIFSF